MTTATQPLAARIGPDVAHGLIRVGGAASADVGAVVRSAVAEALGAGEEEGPGNGKGGGKPDDPGKPGNPGKPGIAGTPDRVVPEARSTIAGREDASRASQGQLAASATDATAESDPSPTLLVLALLLAASAMTSVRRSRRQR